MSKTVNPYIRLIAAALLPTIWSATTAADIIYVDPNAPPGGDGQSWTTAYKYLQDALFTAEYGNQIWVAQGICKPDQDEGGNVSPGDRGETFLLENGVALYGGFPLGGGTWEQRDPNRYETILTGDLNGNDGPDFDNYGDNSYHVVTGSDTDATAGLDGFTITSGNASGSISVGGGMYNNPNGSPTINNCRFENNLAGNHGGGMYNREASNPTITDTLFINNSAAAKDGGGIYNHSSDPRFSNCLFSGNSAQLYGGAMRNFSNSNPDIVDCRFSANFADVNGGAIYNSGSTPDISGCTFTGNLTNGNGGGIYNSSSNTKFVNCLFNGNSAGNEGGGIYNWYSNPQLVNSTLSGNSAGVGGGMYNIGSNPAIANCVFWANTDTDGTGTAESAQINGGFPQVTYSCIQDDNPNDSYIPFDCPDCNNIDDYPMFVHDPNNGGDGWGDDPCTPGIDEGANDDFGDLHLLPGSPCIDAGDNTMVPPDTHDLDDDLDTTELTPLDLDYNLRFIDDPETIETGNPDPSHDPNIIVDMGAYEYQLVAEEKYCGGTGTAEDPYQICDPNYMQEIGANPNDWDKHFKLIADIDLSAYTGTEFNLIGQWVWYSDPCNDPFTGVFDGNDHTISNFTYISTGYDSVGLFGHVEDGHIKNLRLINIDVDAGTDSYNVGGLVGTNHGTITNCFLSGSVSGDERVGGLVGRNSWLGGNINQCQSQASVSGRQAIGGLCGINDATIINCKASGVISGGDDSYNLGGLSGVNFGTLGNCCATGNINGGNGSYNLGGLCGENSSTVTILNCYASGAVTGGDSSYNLGGLCGKNYYGTIIKCYAIGEVAGGDSSYNLGGLCGYQSASESEMTDSFWNIDTETIGYNLDPCSPGTVTNVIGKTTSQMQLESTYTSAGWDFVDETANGTDDIWKICEDAGYPRLSWEYRALDGDVSNDCMVNLVDLAIVSYQWMDAPGDPSADIAPPGGDGAVNSDDLLVVAANWLTGAEVPAGEIIVNLSMDESWMYQNLSGSTLANLTATASIISDPAGNSSYSYTWEFILPGDVTVEPSTISGGGTTDASWNFAAPNVNQPQGLSDSGQAVTVRVTVTGDDFTNTGQAEAQFGIALLADVNNDTVVNIADRSIINAFWRTGAAGSFTLRDCDINSDGTVNIADRSIANAVWRGSLGQTSVSQPCPLR